MKSVTKWRIFEGRLEGMLGTTTIRTSEVEKTIKSEQGERFVITRSGSCYRLVGPQYLGELKGSIR